MLTFRRIHRTIAAVLLVLYLPGCSTWRPAPLSPEVVRNESKVRLTLTDWVVVELEDPWVSGDSIHGYRWGGEAGDWGRTQWASPFDSLLSVQVARTDPLRTAEAIVVITTLALGAITFVGGCISGWLCE